jgi:hypothetical protein
VGTAITGIDLKAKAFLTFPDIFLDKWLPVSPSPRLPISPSPRLPISPSPHLPITPSPRLPITPSLSL